MVKSFVSTGVLPVVSTTTKLVGATSSNTGLPAVSPGGKQQQDQQINFNSPGNYGTALLRIDCNGQPTNKLFGVRMFVPMTAAKLDATRAFPAALG